MIKQSGPIRVLVVDDEPLARDRIVLFLDTQDEFQLVAALGDGEAALKHLFETQPDVLLLDIEMPGKNGFEVLNHIPVERRPLCIFITAYPQHAVKAFEVEALDYVLKPFRAQRLAEALNRAKVRLQERTSKRAAQAHKVNQKAVTIDIYGSQLSINPEDIDWLVADGNYVKIQAGGRTYFKRVTLSKMLTQLEPWGFIQVHRSILVNRVAIQQSQYLGNNAFRLTMKDGKCFRTARGYKQMVKNLMNEGDS